HFDNIKVAQIIGTVALSAILFSGGLDTKVSDIKPVLGPGTTLATLGVLVTAVATGVTSTSSSTTASEMVHPDTIISTCLRLS
ncbi:MAG: potassium/proton antiporter, partial [Bacteroidales bacterium]|nr:potassium/proton antiporter [Bacteroidales bacterium]